jgi:hypothetical protein
MTNSETPQDPLDVPEEPPKKKLLFEPSKFNPPARVGGLLMFVTGALLLKYELIDLTQFAQQLNESHFQPLYSLLGGVLVALGLLILVFGEHADALLGRNERRNLPSRILLWVLVAAPGAVAWCYDYSTLETRSTPAKQAEPPGAE